MISPGGPLAAQLYHNLSFGANILSVIYPKRAPRLSHRNGAT